VVDISRQRISEKGKQKCFQFRSKREFVLEPSLGMTGRFVLGNTMYRNVQEYLRVISYKIDITGEMFYI